MKRLLFIFFAVLIFGCNGDVISEYYSAEPVEKPVITIVPNLDILQAGVKDYEDKGEVEEIELGDGFRQTGYYSFTVQRGGMEINCPVYIYRKEFIESFIYVQIDCEDERIVQKIYRK